MEFSTNYKGLNELSIDLYGVDRDRFCVELKDGVMTIRLPNDVVENMINTYMAQEMEKH